MHCIAILCVIATFSSCFGQRPCNLFCEDTAGDRNGPLSISSKGYNGSPGKRGPQGVQGPRGEKGDACEYDCTALENFHERIEEKLDERNRFKDLRASCEEILTNITENTQLVNGIYYIRDKNGFMFPVYCDMATNGGGWTLVGTVHENNIRNGTGRCTTGDKWSSENGNERGSQRGGEAWFDYDTFGSVTSATSNDYKNPAYYDLTARDVMIWQVPNNTPLEQYNSDAYLKFRTTNGFLSQYGGNMFQLFNRFYPLKSGTYSSRSGNGPIIPVTFDEGNATELHSHYGKYIRKRTDAGFIMFRAINNEQSAYALCPGLRPKNNERNLEHACIGSTGDNVDVRYCGDFASFNWDNYGTGQGPNTDLTLLQTTFMIFYR